MEIQTQTFAFKNHQVNFIYFFKECGALWISTEPFQKILDYTRRTVLCDLVSNENRMKLSAQVFKGFSSNRTNSRLWFVNEVGLFQFINGSSKPEEAQIFSTWIQKILPKLAKPSYFSPDPKIPQPKVIHQKIQYNDAPWAKKLNALPKEEAYKKIAQLEQQAELDRLEMNKEVEEAVKFIKANMPQSSYSLENK